MATTDKSDPSLAALLAEIERRSLVCLVKYAAYPCLSPRSGSCQNCLLAAAARALRESETSCVYCEQPVSRIVKEIDTCEACANKLSRGAASPRVLSSLAAAHLMTGPEAIAAAERLLKSITPGTWRRGSLRYRSVEGQAFDGSVKLICEHVYGGTAEQAEGNADLIVAAPELVATLRAALLQSQEALQACDSFLKNIEWNDSTSENQACDLREQIRQAALLSSPVAPKEQRTS